MVTTATHKNMSPDVAQVFASYPEDVRPSLLELRQLILDVAQDMPAVGSVEETLKWGEPSYLAKHGSTIRIGWKAQTPEHYAMYFICNTKLVDTFREVYPDKFTFDGNRALVFHKADELPLEALRHCVSVALRYHEVKHLPLLGF